MITLLIVALPKSLPTVNQCAAVPRSGPAGISAAGVQRGEMESPSWGTGLGSVELEKSQDELQAAAGPGWVCSFSVCFQRHLSMCWQSCLALSPLSLQKSSKERVNQSEKQNAPILPSCILGSLLSNAGNVSCWEYSKSYCSWIPGCLLKIGISPFSWGFPHLFSCLWCFLRLCPAVGSGWIRLQGSDVTGLCGTGLWSCSRVLWAA